MNKAELIDAVAEATDLSKAEAEKATNAVLDSIIDVLSKGGVFLCKVLQGGTEKELLGLLKQNFKTVRHVKPPASRPDSAELYVLATGFRGRQEAVENV